ncbi:MAG: GNAT family N-acetyltransferase [Brevundimonas sp.]
MTESLRFTEATHDDLTALHGLVHGAYRGDSARRGWTHEADLLDGQRIDRPSLEAALADPAQRIILAWQDDILTGCVQVTDRGDGLAYLGMLSVDPARQGGGLGRRLIAAAEDAARDRFGARRMEMTVIVQRIELIDWYVRRGYVRTGETRPFPATDPRFGLPRRNDLAFTVLVRALDGESAGPA